MAERDLPADHLNRAIGLSLTAPTRDVMQVVKILRRAAEIVETPDRWCQGAHCRIGGQDISDSLIRIRTALSTAAKMVNREDAKRLFDVANRVCLEGALHQADLELFPPQPDERECADITKVVNFIAVYIKLNVAKYKIVVDERDLNYYAKQWVLQIHRDETYIVPQPYVFNDWWTTTPTMVAALLRDVADQQELNA